ncbi:hypothetical protein ACHQM5_021479 [Ranunculus cassubicifolius]
MEVSPPCNGGTSELLVRRLGSKKIYASRNQRGNRNSDTEESLIAKFGNALRAFLHVKDSQLQFSDCNSLPSEDTQLQFPDNNILPSEDAQRQFPDSNILPSEDAQELISAMKGTREKLGIMPLTKLTVTWSPDVYDPPVTSVTHTVTGRNHHHRSRNKKTNTSSKRHKGGKSSQGSSSKRHHKHASKSDHHHRSKSSSSASSSSSPPSSSSSSPISSSERSVFGGYESSLDYLDFESTCGSSFLGKSVAEVLAPFAEAK